MTFDGLKSEPNIVCDSSVSPLDEIKAFSRRQAVLAAVCDSALVAIMVIVLELSFMVLVVSIPVFERVVSELVGMTVLITLPVVAPLILHLLWQGLRQSSSPGDKWLGICLDSDKESWMIQLSRELGIGLLATTAIGGMLWGCRAILSATFSFDLWVPVLLMPRTAYLIHGTMLVSPGLRCLQ